MTAIADRFLREVQRMHQLHPRPAARIVTPEIRGVDAGDFWVRFLVEARGGAKLTPNQEVIEK
jgi:hypothetical protein